jgi:hypothetical protein
LVAGVIVGAAETEFSRKSDRRDLEIMGPTALPLTSVLAMERTERAPVDAANGVCLDEEVE